MFFSLVLETGSKPDSDWVKVDKMVKIVLKFGMTVKIPARELVQRLRRDPSAALDSQWAQDLGAAPMWEVDDWMRENWQARVVTTRNAEVFLEFEDPKLATEFLLRHG